MYDLFVIIKQEIEAEETSEGIHVNPNRATSHSARTPANPYPTVVWSGTWSSSSSSTLAPIGGVDDCFVGFGCLVESGDIICGKLKSIKMNHFNFERLLGILNTVAII